MNITAKSLSGEYISIDIPKNSRIEEEFEKKYKELYVDRKMYQFISVKLLKTDEVKNEFSFIVNTHRMALCLEKYKRCWTCLSRNPHPYILEMFENLDEEEKFEHVYEGISSNPVAIEFFLKNPDKIIWSDMLKYNNRVSELIHLYKHPDKCKIIRYSPDAYNFVYKSKSHDINWCDFLNNKHIKPEWVQYVIEKEPTVWGEYYDDEGEAYGEFNYTFKLKNKHWQKFSKMPIMIPLLINNFNKICWKELCENPCFDAIDILRKNRHKVVISSLCNNHTQQAIDFLEEISPELDINKKAWSLLCRNPYALDILNRYPHSIKYLQLAKNTNERAVEMIEIHLSISTLSKKYKNGILKKLINNHKAGWLVLELFDNGKYGDIHYNYSTNIISDILTSPYIFI
jgi:hypothetical protein